LLEYDRSEHPFRQAVLTTAIEADAGTVRIPQAVGLGVVVDRSALQRFAKHPAQERTVRDGE
jgi:D-galactarolactone cycloisomerase